MNVRMMIGLIMSIPKTVWFNFRYLPFNNAKHFPVFIWWRTRIIEMGKNRIIVNKLGRTVVKIGVPHRNYPADPVVLDIRGKLVFNGKASISTGCQLNVAGNLVIGDDFGCSSGTKIDAKADSSIGDNCSFGHNCYLADDDGHEILSYGDVTNYPKGYHIGNHVWLCRGVTVLKGTRIADNCIVGAGAVVSGVYEKDHVILASGKGITIIKENVDWKR